MRDHGDYGDPLSPCHPEPLETTQGVESVPKDLCTSFLQIAASGRSPQTLGF